MDRWADADDDITARKKAQPQGRVASQGLGGFVRSTAEGVNNGGVTKIEVVASKKERVKQAQDAAAMPPPPPRLHPASTSQPSLSAEGMPPPSIAHPGIASNPIALQIAQPSSQPPEQGQHGFQPPPWASQPVPGACIEVLKGDELVQEIPLNKVATVFGRHISADVICDHPSLSRHHAAICFQGMTGKCMVLDLGSTHGTFVAGKRVDKAVPTELENGGELKFAASTRCYILRLPKRPLEYDSMEAAEAKRRKQMPNGSSL